MVPHILGVNNLAPCLPGPENAPCVPYVINPHARPVEHDISAPDILGSIFTCVAASSNSPERIVRVVCVILREDDLVW